MITIKHGSIFDSTADVLVCPVNCVGVMGKGLALEFKRRFPKMYAWYRVACSKNEIVPGRHYLWGAVMLVSTKLHWREPSKHCWVESCLKEIADTAPSYGWLSIAIPQLGCGCGGLDWADVWPLYEKHLGGLDADVEVWIHE